MTQKLIIVLIALTVSLLGNIAEGREMQGVVFDYGNVVGYSDYPVMIHFLQETFPMNEHETRILLDGLGDALQRGETEQEYWILQAACHGRILDGIWFHQWESVKARATKQIEESVVITRELKERGLVVALLSNVRPHKARMIRGKGYYDVYDPLLLSCEMGVSKPHVDAFQNLIRSVSLPPETLVFVDDKPSNIAVAAELGFDAILFENPGQLRAALVERGLLD